MRILRIGGANIDCPVNFSNASIYFLKAADDMPFALGRAFRNGFVMLKAYLHSNPEDPCIPENPEYRDTLRKLLKFLEEQDDAVTAALEDSCLPEWNLTFRLAQHVFSKLSPHLHFKFDVSKKPYLGILSKDKDETFYGVREDTSFGWEYGWHGKVDIIMPDVAVFSENDDAGFDSPSPSFCSETQSCESVEVKKKAESFSYKEYGQFGAQTIAFSFLKNKEENQDITMIPSIAISPEKVQVHCYDCIKDVFVQSGPVTFIGMLRTKDGETKRQLTLPSILLIWLTLNYKLFMTMDDIDVKSGLHKLIDVDKFKREIKSPCHSLGGSTQEWVAETGWPFFDIYKLLEEPQDFKEKVTMKLMSEINQIYT